MPATVQNKELFLTFSGQTRGCFQFKLNVDSQATLQAYEVGMKYYYKKDTDKGDLQILDYPLFTNADLNTGMEFAVSLDPLDSFNSKFDVLKQSGTLRTYLAFTGNNYQNEEAPKTILSSNLRTDFGKMLPLLPKANFKPDTYDIPENSNAMLVISRGDACGDSAAGYLVPQGDFYILQEENPNTIGGPTLLCGLAGTETISYTSGTESEPADLMRFYPHQGAYSPRYPFVETSPVGPPVDLQEALLNISYFYDRDIKESISRLQAMIQPGLVLFLGGIVIWIIFSVLGPIYDLITQIKI